MTKHANDERSPANWRGHIALNESFITLSFRGQKAGSTCTDIWIANYWSIPA
jgi:hypothetical protein